jgi:hypothetical protein
VVGGERVIGTAESYRDVVVLIPSVEVILICVNHYSTPSASRCPTRGK